MISFEMRAGQVVAVDEQGTIIAYYGSTEGIPPGTPVLEHDDPAIRGLMDAWVSGQMQPEQADNLKQYLTQANIDSAVRAYEQAQAQRTGQPAPGQTVAVREQVPDINATTNVAEKETSYEARRNRLLNDEAVLNQQWAQQAGFGPSPWAPIMAWSPDGQSVDAQGNPVTAAVQAGQASFPENLRTPADYTNAYAARGSATGDADLTAREAEMARRTNEYKARVEGARRLTEVGDLDRAIREGRQDLQTAEAWSASKAANDQQLQPGPDGSWVHGPNSGLARGIQDAERKRERLTSMYYPDQYMAGQRAKISATSPKYVTDSWGLTPEELERRRKGEDMVPPYAAGGQVPQIQTFRAGGRVGMEMLPPSIRQFAPGGQMGYSSGYSGQSQAVTTGPQDGGWGNPAHAPLVKRQQQADDLRFQTGLDDRGQAAALARIEQQKNQVIERANAAHATRMQTLQARIAVETQAIQQEAFGQETEAAGIERARHLPPPPRTLLATYAG